MTNLQNAISCLDRLNSLELDYLRSLVTARMSQSPDVSLLLRLPRELRDRIYYFAAAEFLEEWPSEMTEECRAGLLLSGCQRPYQKFHGFEMVNKQIRKEFFEVAYGSDLVQGAYLDQPKSPDWSPIPSDTIKFLIKHPITSFDSHEIYKSGLHPYSQASAMEVARYTAERRKLHIQQIRAVVGWPRNQAYRPRQYYLYGYLQFPSKSDGPQCFVVKIPYLQLYEFWNDECGLEGRCCFSDRAVEATDFE